MRLRNLKRLWRTVRHLKSVQITNRLSRRIFRPRVDMRPAPPLRRPLNEAAFMRRSERLTATGHFIFLNRSGTLEKPQDWNDPRQPKLWLYNLHYFD